MAKRSSKPAQGILSRIAFAKYLYSIGVEQSKLPHPMHLASALTFHDSVEIFLHAACEHNDVRVPPKEFLGYFKVLKEKIGVGEVAHELSIERLNRVRVELKHRGIRFSHLEVESLRSSVTSFFLDNSRPLFALDFSEISLVELVSQEDVKAHLIDGQKAARDGNRTDALRSVAIAYVELIENLERRTKMRSRRSPFDFNRLKRYKDLSVFRVASGPSSKACADTELRRELERYSCEVADSLDLTQNAVKILALGIDYRKYVRFINLVPSVIKTRAGTYRQLSRVQSYSPTDDDLRFCIDFVVECSVAVSEMTIGD